MKNIASEVLTILSPDLAWHYRAIPISSDKSTLRILTVKNDHTTSFISELTVLTGKQIIPEYLEDDVLLKLLEKYYRKSSIVETDGINQDSIDFLKRVTYEAKSLLSSDIHFEIYESIHRIRFRIDGQLIERYRLQKEDYQGIVNKIKILSNLDISEKRLPQDGRINLEVENKVVDIRVSIIPCYFGEKVVLRILANDSNFLSIEDLGFSNHQLSIFKNNYTKNKGLILVSGPTGSGKTTTLYSTLKEINSTEKNILTIEDPIEYTIPGINQVQLKESIGLTFSRVLKSFLRQDPDIIMIGEIRDEDTAQIAVRSALTGHLVLSTIHTQDAWGILERLLNLGIPKYLIHSTLNLAVAQRLLRKLCSMCKSQDTDGYFRATGCSNCHYTGYKGRIAIYELIEINSDTITAFEKELTKKDLYEHLKIKTLQQSASELYEKGITSLEELSSILGN